MNSKFFLILLFWPTVYLNAQQNIRPGVRAHHSLVYDEDAKAIILTGGSTPLDGGNSFKFYNDVWSFNGKEWISKGQAGDERSGISLAYDTKRKRIYSFGGFTGDNRARSEFRIFENNQWQDLSSPGFTAAESGMVYDAHRDKLVVFGGSGYGLNRDTWEWDGNAWKKFDGANPEGRQAFVMVYDEARKKTVVFGGVGSAPGTLLDDTWEFNGKTWQKISVSGPVPRASAGYAYDSDKKLLIIFGGMTKGGFLNDTWSYDGNEWKLLSTDGPQKRAMGYLAYDKQRKKVLLFGGRLGWPNDAADTWEWDGTKWNEIKF